MRNAVFEQHFVDESEIELSSDATQPLFERHSREDNKIDRRLVRTLALQPGRPLSAEAGKTHFTAPDTTEGYEQP